jgi:hypothetical protein
MAFIVPESLPDHELYEFRFAADGPVYTLPSKDDLTIGDAELLEAGSVEKLVGFFPAEVREKIRSLRPNQVEALIADWVGTSLGKSAASSES